MKKFFGRKKKQKEQDITNDTEWYKVIQKEKGISLQELNDLLSLAVLSLNICHTIYQDTAQNKISLSDIAKEVGKGISKQDVQESFQLLVRIGVLENDDDPEYLTFSDDLDDLKDQISEIKENFSSE